MVLLAVSVDSHRRLPVAWPADSCRSLEAVSAAGYTSHALEGDPGEEEVAGAAAVAGDSGAAVAAVSAEERVAKEPEALQAVAADAVQDLAVETKQEVHPLEEERPQACRQLGVDLTQSAAWLLRPF